MSRLEGPFLSSNPFLSRRRLCRLTESEKTPPTKEETQAAVSPQQPNQQHRFFTGTECFGRFDPSNASCETSIVKKRDNCHRPPTQRPPAMGYVATARPSANTSEARQELQLQKAIDADREAIVSEKLREATQQERDNAQEAASQFSISAHSRASSRSRRSGSSTISLAAVQARAQAEASEKTPPTKEETQAAVSPQQPNQQHRFFTGTECL
ncbi:hypothetical protein HPB52_017739 [Rhipicephalus sanguineus]|uniref:Uncharacterized protein n=1 Tax=Rhipicephalus sanguineus TaxID=34632 RepID=A0A9D4Q1M3_RHISA|nr:hypothetical protein HPB52_017739 [Rhipicephalus sanguineus]